MYLLHALRTLRGIGRAIRKELRGRMKKTEQARASKQLRARNNDLQTRYEVALREAMMLLRAAKVLRSICSEKVATMDEHKPNWRSLYERAMLQQDPRQILTDISAAEYAIIERSRELCVYGQQASEEDSELTGAILALCDLRRSAAVSKGSRGRSAA